MYGNLVLLFNLVNLYMKILIIYENFFILEDFNGEKLYIKFYFYKLGLVSR